MQIATRQDNRIVNLIMKWQEAINVKSPNVPLTIFVAALQHDTSIYIHAYIIKYRSRNVYPNGVTIEKCLINTANMPVYLKT